MQEVFEKIIEKLESKLLNLTFQKNDKNKGFNDGIHKAIEIVKQAATEYNNGWIPCNERLPEDGVDVIVWFEYFGYGDCYNRQFQKAGISHTYRGEWSDEVNGQSGWRKLRIIDWQLLPESYQKGEKNMPLTTNDMKMIIRLLENRLKADWDPDYADLLQRVQAILEKAESTM